MLLAVSANGLAAVDWNMSLEAFAARLGRRLGNVEIVADAGRCADAERQIREYLAGARRTFELPLDWSGMGDFQRQALQAVYAIPCGQTSTYREIARQIGRPQAVRAVGRANATNPIPLVIPCHRVIGADGSLRGYGGPGGVSLKRWLLDLEKAP